MLYQEIGKIETARLSLGDSVKLFTSGEKFIAMTAGNTFDTVVFE